MLAGDLRTQNQVNYDELSSVVVTSWVQRALLASGLKWSKGWPTCENSMSQPERISTSERSAESLGDHSHVNLFGLISRILLPGLEACGLGGLTLTHTTENTRRLPIRACDALHGAAGRPANPWESKSILFCADPLHIPYFVSRVLAELRSDSLRPRQASSAGVQSFFMYPPLAEIHRAGGSTQLIFLN